MIDVTAPRYSIIFNGELLPKASRKTALETLTLLTNTTSDDLLDCLFSVKPVIVTQTDDEQLAQQYERQFRAAGLNVFTEPYLSSHDDIINAELSFGHYAPLKPRHSKANFVIDTPALASFQKSDLHQQTGQYLVTFNGSLHKDYERKQVIANLCSLTNSSEQDVIENIFSTIPVIISQTDDHQLAQTYQHAFEQSGLVVEVLSDEQFSNPEIAARSSLLIRDDKPSTLPKKKVRCFTYALYGLAAIACLGWGAIYLVIDSYLKEDVESPIQIQLVKYKAVEKIAEPTTAPIKEVNTAREPQATKHRVTEPFEAQKKAVKPITSPEQKTVPVKGQEKMVANIENKQQQLKWEYNLELLNWFAQFQQLNDLESKYAEGEITLRLTISRNGEIKKIEVLKSTSEELRSNVVMQLRKIKTVPGIPIQITGSEYAFDLPLRYRFN